MQTRYRTYSLQPSAAPIAIRTLICDVDQHGLPSCAWCRLKTLQPLADLVHEGPITNLITKICYCAWCEKSTIIEFEARRKPE